VGPKNPGALAENGFWCIWSLKEHIWWR